LPIRVSWSVSNQGSTDADQDWTDQIVYSTDALIGDADDVVIASFRHSGGLRVGESYSQTAEVAIPIRSAGRYHLGIRSDSGTEVLEPDTRADNQTARAIDIIAPYADLVLDEVNVPRGARERRDHRRQLGRPQPGQRHHQSIVVERSRRSLFGHDAEQRRPGLGRCGGARGRPGGGPETPPAERRSPCRETSAATIS
jgi:hypothetical protein